METEQKKISCLTLTQIKVIVNGADKIIPTGKNILLGEDDALELQKLGAVEIKTLESELLLAQAPNNAGQVVLDDFRKMFSEEWEKLKLEKMSENDIAPDMEDISNTEQKAPESTIAPVAEEKQDAKAKAK